MGKRILKGEKEAAAKKAAENPEAVAESVEGPQEEVPKLIQNEKREPAVDNRKLIYEDIWDEVPATSSSAVPVPTRASARHKATNASDFFPATDLATGSFEGSCPGWYFGTGDRGLGYYRDTNRPATQETPPTESTAEEPKKTNKSWYNDMQAKMKEKTDDIDRRIREGRAEKEQRKAWLNAAAKGASFEVPQMPSEAASKDETRQPFAPPPRRAEVEPPLPARTTPDPPDMPAPTLSSELHDMD